MEVQENWDQGETQLSQSSLEGERSSLRKPGRGGVRSLVEKNAISTNSRHLNDRKMQRSVWQRAWMGGPGRACPPAGFQRPGWGRGQELAQKNSTGVGPARQGEMGENKAFCVRGDTQEAKLGPSHGLWQYL